MAGPASLWGRAAPAQAVAQAFLPEEGRGLLRALPWDALQPGEWDTRTVEISTARPELRSVMAALNAQLAASELPGARAKLVITLWQPGLKKVALRIFWQPAGEVEQSFRAFGLRPRGERLRMGPQMNAGCARRFLIGWVYLRFSARDLRP